MRRIKTEGPTLKDITKSYKFDVKDKEGRQFQQEYTWVPKDVVTAAGHYVIKEPEWDKLPEMSYMELYQVRLILLGTGRIFVHVHPCCRYP